MKKTEDNGITLIALVVTIIVLLILAGITISLVIGQNGIITRAKEAKERQEIATEKEQLEMAKMAVKTSKLSKGDITAMTAAELNEEMVAEGIKATATGANPIIVTFTESQREYEVTDEGEPGVNWDEILNNTTTPHPDQTESNDIGIGTDGELVNLDLWRYTQETSSSYALHGSPLSGGYYNGYIGEFVDGKIIGKIPQYIKAENGKFLPVISMDTTFENCETLITVPEIPSTVTNMAYTFSFCSSLTTAPIIPNGVISMSGTFRNCTNLTTAPVIPNTVTNINYTFSGCSSLTTAPVIPNTVTNMAYTFRDCSSLTTAPEIPNSVTDMSGTFSGCTNLIIAPEIPNGVIKMNSIFSGCSSLTTAPVIPSTVTNMYSTFEGCSSLTTAPMIPNGVISMSSTFRNCTNLTTAPVIPDSVTNMYATFSGCSNLAGELVINANPSGYTECLLATSTSVGANLKLTGSSTKLNEILATKSDNSNISIK